MARRPALRTGDLVFMMVPALQDPFADSITGRLMLVSHYDPDERLWVVFWPELVHGFADCAVAPRSQLHLMSRCVDGDDDSVTVYTG